MIVDPVRAIADAVLYEGYVLWPYRRSALKNQRRFQFGVVHPPAHTAAHPDDACVMQTEVLVSAGSRVSVTVRFLHIISRAVHDADGRQVDELEVGGQRWQSWEEAVERELRVEPATVDTARAVPIAIPAGLRDEPLPEGAGAIVRRWEALVGSVELSAAPAAQGYRRLRVRIANATAFGGGSREQALPFSFCSAHTLLSAHEGEFVSLTDPPDALAAAAAACENVGTWPVLVGDPGARDRILSSPILLEDYPRVAAESPGDLFDGGEIDCMLVLNILALTDEEKAQMAASDPRAREILQRTESLTPEQRLALHGTIRPLETAR